MLWRGMVDRDMCCHVMVCHAAMCHVICLASIRLPSLLVAIIVVLVSVTPSLAQPSLPATTAYSFIGLMYILAVAALSCLAVILFKNPGTIERTPENCYPLPGPVSQRLLAGAARAPLYRAS